MRRTTILLLTCLALVGAACGADGDATASEVLPEDVLSRHRGARVRVVEDPEGGWQVVPLRTSERP